tara:strand:+ start:997 stop:2004 length:1008 start_codon:yes stop_codon:yes gene_type:complete
MKLPHTSLEEQHLPVMINEVLDICNPKNGGNFLDCTFGGGGYSSAILKFQNAKVVALDRDSQVSVIANKLKKKFDSRFIFFNEKFSNLHLISKIKFDAVIFDLGLSSIQLDNLLRGFSFKSKSELNMSMGLTDTSAKEALNTLSKINLKNIIKIFGDEKDASVISRNIIKERNYKQIETTDELVKIIKRSKTKSYKKRKIDESTKTFQAIRIFVNKEISELIEGLIKATKILKPGGKLVILSFHSIEDKIIKFYFKNFSKNRSRSNKYLPENSNLSLFDNYKNKIIKASTKELNRNPRSRSAKLRVATRSTEKFIDPKELRMKFKYLTDLEKYNA